MRDTISYDQFDEFFNAIRQRSAIRVLELGAAESSFSMAMIHSAHWAPKIELHCAHNGSASYDDEMIKSAEGISTVFDVTKHIGSEAEVNEVILQLAASSPFDAIFISGASSKEALLTAFLVSNESLKSNGVLGLSTDISGDPSMTAAISSFSDMLGDAFQHVSDHVFVKV
jgi:hypothetical protein